MLIAIIVSFFFGFALAVYFCEHNNKKALDGREREARQKAESALQETRDKARKRWGRSLDISKRMIDMNADVISKRSGLLK